jgi:hypothetical protein
MYVCVSILINTLLNISYFYFLPKKPDWKYQ